MSYTCIKWPGLSQDPGTSDFMLKLSTIKKSSTLQLPLPQTGRLFDVHSKKRKNIGYHPPREEALSSTPNSIDYWKLIFKISGFLTSRSRIICPKRPFAHENLSITRQQLSSDQNNAPEGGLGGGGGGGGGDLISKE